jgi:hypothetical protein
VQHVAAVRRAAPALPPDRFREVRYEELQERPEDAASAPLPAR